MAENKTTVVKTGNGGAMALIALVVVILAVVLFLLFGQGLLNGSAKNIDANVKIDAPTKS